MPVMNRFSLSSATALLLSAFALAATAGQHGLMGFSMKVETEGFFLNPTLKSVHVDRVLPGSPAARAGMTAGDEIVQVEGHTVVGAKAMELKPYMQREVGEMTHLLIRKPNGSESAVTLTAVPQTAAD
jgi:C-terminal processing protease CtpA/Prc